MIYKKHDRYSDFFICSGKTFKDFLEMLPREWLSEDLQGALDNRGIKLTPIMYVLLKYSDLRLIVRKISLYDGFVNFRNGWQV